MSHEVDIHQAQTLILRELLFKEGAGFSELQKLSGLESDNFTFHIKRLVEIGYLRKDGKSYHLTPSGKEHANKLDTDQNTIERQPKTAVLLAVERNVKGKSEWVMQERLKHPYFGFWGFATGKIRWGETIIEAAARELMEETNLTADYEYCGIYHELVHEEESGELLEDKIFHLVHCTNPKGELLEEFEGGRNAWMSEAEARKLDKKFTSFDIEIGMVNQSETFIEQHVYYSNKLF